MGSWEPVIGTASWPETWNSHNHDEAIRRSNAPGRVCGNAPIMGELGTEASSKPVIEEIFGHHHRLRYSCLQVQPVTC